MKGTLIIILLIISLTSYSQDTIFWQPNYHLKWEDFQGKADSTKSALATSYVGFIYSTNIINGKLQFKVKCYFLKRTSWSKYNMQALMEHEQGHFDIAKLVSLKLEQNLKSYNQKGNISQDIVTIYNQAVREKIQIDSVYDKIEQQNPMTDIPQKKFLKTIRDQIVTLQKSLLQK